MTHNMIRINFSHCMARHELAVQALSFQGSKKPVRATDCISLHPSVPLDSCHSSLYLGTTIVCYVRHHE